MKGPILLAGLAFFAISCTNNQKIKYPVAHKDNVVDDYFGHKVNDPYRWLEDDNSEETAKWVKAENKVTNAFLGQIPYRDNIRKQLTGLWDYPKYSAPFKRAGKYFYYRNSGLQNQSVLYVQDNLNAEPRALLDPNKLSDDGTVALSAARVSNDGKYLVYFIARSGSDWNEGYVLDIKTGEKLPDHLRWIKFSGIGWDGDGFYYSRYPKPEGGNALSQSNEYHRVYFHRVGTSQSDDKMVYDTPDHPKRMSDISVTRDEKIQYLTEYEASIGNSLYVRANNDKKTEWKPVYTAFDKEFQVIDDVDGRLLVMTNYKAPRYRLVSIDPGHPEEANWLETIPESDDVLSDASVVGGKICASYMKDAHTVLQLFQADGKLIGNIELPEMGSASILIGDKNDNEAFYTFESWTMPNTIYQYDVATGQSKVFRQPELKFNPNDFETRQVFYVSKDGTKVPMFIFMKKGTKLDGMNPALLYGYGGFNISLTPYFSPARMVFLEQGGVYAVANLRGGGEYGEAWHEAGTKMHKQNVFDDCIAAAEYLVEKKYTDTNHLALMGGSNGGLLVGAVINQRPDLFRLAIPQVGVMDMLRYNKFTIGWSWAGDYGTSGDSEEMFKYLYAYSPYHNIKKDGHYPAILALTADHDDRVVPAHTFKYMARMQDYNDGKNPTLVRIETKAGHGGGKPTSKIIDEYTDIWSFVLYEMGVGPKFN
ncbi:prolyl oligopeptidase family protein [Prolixibacter sp. SD074]|uniref:prolyl oligopeptidase family serine peptidase n=1 Tax=Prolixibacter sp. SD074 TaxID=2652391 RepID=UPI00127449AC|nr:prolyl oligopeptidase family serine peptidase [Prolixibacter sp. SD074]GET30864.1 prolyl endopeptidase [Prolixibacter sp. SD074]